ncbi:bifunctional hydroxymethylpyrimidine kinase/phosphomethylpyrimidine kinase [Allorhizobium undicola]|uniref:bifunctional hydroxymethylpyrimidine kinase/phosphomethylpyrimidine kinase n=1 Tax=Allorhizobium undicola TaxID=78527 RepID=UPI003D358170
MQDPIPGQIANVLSIAGSDPSGGAGIQADLKTFAACATFGMAAITALTAQNTRGVSAVMALEPSFVRAQIEAVFADIRVDAVKVGMIANAGIATAIADCLDAHPDIPVVLDPVMVAKGGASLLEAEAVGVLKTRLLARATLVTPNLPEVAALLGDDEAVSRAAMGRQAEALMAMGARAVLVKGGHLPGPQCPDLLVERSAAFWFEGQRIETVNTHGTGCSLSSAIAAEIAKGQALRQAVSSARTWLGGAIRTGGALSVGSGHGPIHHFHALWSRHAGHD